MECKKKASKDLPSPAQMEKKVTKIQMIRPTSGRESKATVYWS